MAFRILRTKLPSLDSFYVLDQLVQRPVYVDKHLPDGVCILKEAFFATRTSGRPPIQSISIGQRYREAKPIHYRPDTAGIIADRYQGPRRWITPLDFFHPAGWEEISERIKHLSRNLYSFYLCRKHINNFKIRGLKPEAFDIYKKTSEALAAGNIDVLRKIVTASLLMELKKEISARKAASWARIHWALCPPPAAQSTKLVQARVVGMPSNKFTPSFVQCTFLFKNKQTFAAFDRSGKLKVGSKDEEIEVEDCWVFERLLQKDSFTSSWRVASRLNIKQT